MLELGLVGETDLLKALATHYKVYFISSEKLSKAEVPRAVVDMIPQRFAEKLGVCPLMFDAKTHALSVVTADPEDVEALREAQLASGAREVKGDLRASGGGQGAHREGLLRRHPRLRPPRPAGARADARCRVYGGHDIALDDGPPAAAAAAGRDQAGRRPPLPLVARAPAPAAPAPTEKEPALAAAADRGRGQKVSDASFVELLHVLVSLLESTRADLRGHSAEVARLVRRMGEKLGLESRRARRCSSSRPSSTTSARWGSTT